MRVIFVRRGQFSTYDVLVERCQLLDDVDVRWDRRLGEERRCRRLVASLERRRRADRRKPSDPDIDHRGYTVVDLPNPSDSVF
jgi:hypothetical protein